MWSYLTVGSWSVVYNVIHIFLNDSVIHRSSPSVETGSTKDDRPNGLEAGASGGSVSYTHLDVYKRQLLTTLKFSFFGCVLN